MSDKPVWVCSNRACTAVFSNDPQGPCPVCAVYMKRDGTYERDGGWSTMRRDVQGPDTVLGERRALLKNAESDET